MHSRFIEKSITVLILYIVYSEGRTSKSKNGAQLLLTLNEHNYFITLIFLKQRHKRIVIFSDLMLFCKNKE